jgi:cell division protein FtsB
MVKELEHRQRVKKAIYSWPSLILLTLITFFLVKGAANIFLIERENASRVQELENQSASLVLRERELKSEIEKLKTPEGIIEAIKDKFSATREGEYVAIIVDERKKATSTPQSKDSWYKSVWNAIMRDK